MNVELTQVLLATLPALLLALSVICVVGIILKKEVLKQRFILMKEAQKELLPLKIQACERFSLLAERNNLPALVLRIAPIGEDKLAYKQLLVATLQQEFEHNLSQQIYVSDKCWQAVVVFRQKLIQDLINYTEDTSLKTAEDLRQHIIADDQQATTKVMLQSILRSEINILFEV